jgi:hypothetical protein
MNLMLLLAHNSRINHSMFVKKGTMLDFYQIRLTHNQSISNMAFLVVKRLWVSRIMAHEAFFIENLTDANACSHINTTNRKSLVLLEIPGALILDWSNEPSTRLNVSPNQAFQGHGADYQPSSLDPQRCQIPLR